MPRLFIKGESTEVVEGEGDVGWLIIWSIAGNAEYLPELPHGDVFLVKKLHARWRLSPMIES
jgi:hypothetical protein